MAFSERGSLLLKAACCTLCILSLISVGLGVFCFVLGNAALLYLVFLIIVGVLGVATSFFGFFGVGFFASSFTQKADSIRFKFFTLFFILITFATICFGSISVALFFYYFSNFETYYIQPFNSLKSLFHRIESYKPNYSDCLNFYKYVILACFVITFLCFILSAFSTINLYISVDRPYFRKLFLPSLGFAQILIGIFFIVFSSLLARHQLSPFKGVESNPENVALAFKSGFSYSGIGLIGGLLMLSGIFLGLMAVEKNAVTADASTFRRTGYSNAVTIRNGAIVNGNGDGGGGSWSRSTSFPYSISLFTPSVIMPFSESSHANTSGHGGSARNVHTISSTSRGAYEEKEMPPTLIPITHICYVTWFYLIHLTLFILFLVFFAQGFFYAKGNVAYMHTPMKLDCLSIHFEKKVTCKDAAANFASITCAVYGNGTDGDESALEKGKEEEKESDKGEKEKKGKKEKGMDGIGMEMDVHKSQLVREGRGIEGRRNGEREEDEDKNGETEMRKQIVTSRKESLIEEKNGDEVVKKNTLSSSPLSSSSASSSTDTSSSSSSSSSHTSLSSSLSPLSHSHPQSESDFLVTKGNLTTMTYKECYESRNNPQFPDSMLKALGEAYALPSFQIPVIILIISLFLLFLIVVESCVLCRPT